MLDENRGNTDRLIQGTMSEMFTRKSYETTNSTHTHPSPHMHRRTALVDSSRV